MYGVHENRQELVAGKCATCGMKMVARFLSRQPKDVMYCDACMGKQDYRIKDVLLSPDRERVLERKAKTMTEASISIRALQPNDQERAGLDAEPRDTVILAELGGKRVGLMKIVAMPYVHDFRIDAGLVNFRVAELMLQYAQGYCRASGFTEALALVPDSNPEMQQWLLLNDRAMPEEPGRAYLIGVK